jgi:urea transporter
MASNSWKKQAETSLEAILNSYSILFFLNNRWMALAVLAASFLNFYAGLSGLIAVALAVAVAMSLGFDATQLRSGVYSFNALITGIGLGTFFETGSVFLVLLILSSLLTLILSVAMGGWLFKYRLPFLSLPFVFTFWIIILPASEYINLGLTHRNIFWMNELYAIGGTSLINLYQHIETMKIAAILEIYLRSLSSVFFQDNLIAGTVVAIGLLLSSRIFFSLSIVGFITAYLFAVFVGSEAASITYYNIGANFIMVAIAVGGFFVIPSRASYFWTIVLVPLTSITLLFFTKLFSYVQLPVFSLPYTLITIFFVHFLQQRGAARSLILTPFQHYSPEINLYSYLNNKVRLTRFLYIPLQLPFWGEWSVTQGYNGAFTHINEWGKALDFMILDQEGKSYKANGDNCDDYFCYGKPICAPADGVVTDIQDGIDDNEIGDVNTRQNWGNSIVLQHSTGVYSQVSHLKKHSVKIKKGEFVKAGDVIAMCGNSGRSPYPHLHFQVQSQPFIGARTIEYPIAYFTEKLQHDTQAELKQFAIPAQHSTLSNLQQSNFLHQAFNILPDTGLCFSWSNHKEQEKTEHWDAFTDAYNYTYLHSRETGAIAYYTCDRMMFYFTSFYGSKKSLLYEFFAAAYTVLLSETTQMQIKDKLPVHLTKTPGVIRALNDFTAPFYNLLKVTFQQRTVGIDTRFDTHAAELFSEVTVTILRKKIKQKSHQLIIDDKGIVSFKIFQNNSVIHAKRTN